MRFIDARIQELFEKVLHALQWAFGPSGYFYAQGLNGAAILLLAVETVEDFTEHRTTDGALDALAALTFWFLYQRTDWRRVERVFQETGQIDGCVALWRDIASPFFRLLTAFSLTYRLILMALAVRPNPVWLGSHDTLNSCLTGVICALMYAVWVDPLPPARTRVLEPAYHRV